jgi:hypothetical protein
MGGRVTAAGALIAAADALGVELRRHGGRLQVLDTNRRLTPELRAALHAHAAEVMEDLEDREDDTARRSAASRATVSRSREPVGWRFWDGTLPPGWTCGNDGIDACAACGHGTAARDVVGVPRHPFRCA